MRGLYSRINDVTVFKPRKIFLEIGTNDIGEPVDTIANYIDLTVKAIKTQSPKTQVYIQAILPRQKKLLSEIESFNAAILQICVKERVNYINTFDWFSENGALNKIYDSGDGLHLNSNGSYRWRQLLLKYLK